MNWIGGAAVPPGQQPLQLTRNIESFEADFANGYLIGEILSSYGLVDLAAFSRK